MAKFPSCWIGEVHLCTGSFVCRLKLMPRFGSAEKDGEFEFA
jgi:hypothetical protein